jgi:hypothetical protein
LKFVFKEKLFLKIQILYGILHGARDNVSLYFWAVPAYQGIDGANNFCESMRAMKINNVKYAKVFLTTEDKNEPRIPVLVEKGMAWACKKQGFPAEVIELELPKESLNEIAATFNIARNNEHNITVALKKEDIHKEKGLFAILSFKGVMFTCINKSDFSIEIVNSERIEKLSKADLQKYAVILATATDDKVEQARVNQIMVRIKKLHSEA